MPSVKIDVSQVEALLRGEEKQTSVSTPFGNAMLEIQGDLEMPTAAPKNNDEEQCFTTHNDETIVRFGLLVIGADNKTVTLYVGRKQRLLGKLIKLDTPLGLLKFDKSTSSVQLEDVFNYKIIFTNRPLPIM